MSKTFHSTALRLLRVIIAQSLWSGANFVVAIYLARQLSLQDFGLFGVGVAGRMFFVSLLGALMLSPLTVVSGRCDKDKNGLFGTSVFFLEILCLFFFAACLVVGFVSGKPLGEYAVFVFGALSVELQRRINFIMKRVSQDLLGGFITITGSVIGIASLIKLDICTLTNVFLMLGLLNLAWAALSGRRYWFNFGMRKEIKILVNHLEELNNRLNKQLDMLIDKMEKTYESLSEKIEYVKSIKTGENNES